MVGVFLPPWNSTRRLLVKCVTEEFVDSQNSCQGDLCVISENAGLENHCKLVN